MKRRNLLKGLLGLPLLGLRGKAEESPKLDSVKPVQLPNAQCLTAMSFTVPEWSAPQHELDALELEIHTLRANRKNRR